MFKKNLFRVTMIATAMSGAMVLSSCSHDDYTYSQEEVQQAQHAAQVAKYEQTFISSIGKPAANQCWDFTKGSVLNLTRGNGNGKGNGHNNQDGAENEESSLTAWPSHSAYTYGFNNKYATGKKRDPLPQNNINSIYNNDLEDIYDAISAAEENEDYKAWPPTGTYVFRTLSTYRSSGSDAKYFFIGGYFDDKNNAMALEGVNKRGDTGNQHTACIKFDMVPEGTIWFAGATSANNKNKISFDAADFPLDDYIEVTVNGNTFWCFKCEGDGAYTDFILWVEKVDDNTVMLEYAKRYMVEDLGGGGASDIDFNDIVFDVEQYTDGTQKCVVRALGGTLPIKIKVGDSDWWSKPEPVASMINTQGTIDYDKVIAEFDVTGWKESENNVQVEVQDNSGYEFIASFPEDGSIPLMVAFSIIKGWNAERVPVTEEWFSTYLFEEDE